MHRPVGEESLPAGDDGVAVDDTLDAEAFGVGERLDRRERDVHGRSRRRRSLARSDARTHPRANRRGTMPPSRCGRLGGDDVDERHLAGGDGAGLVEHDRVDRAGRFEDLGSLDQHAELGAAAGADHQRRRCCQAERTRAGDDQHGDRGGERGRRRVGRGGGDPEPERRGGEDDHDRDEDRRDPVGEALHVGLAGLRVLDHPADLGERGVGADAGGAHDEAAAGVDRCAGDGVAGCDFDGHRLAGQQ